MQITANINHKKVRMSMLISDKVDFGANKITTDKEEQNIVIKGSIHQKHTAILNRYAPNNSTSKNTKQKLIELKGEIDKPIITVLTSALLSQQLVELVDRKSATNKI